MFRGTPALAPNVRGLTPSPTVAINEHCLGLQAEGRRVFKLGLGQSPFPVPEPVVETLRANAHRKDYLAVQGLPALREVVADYHRRTSGVSYSAGDILIGPGSKELMYLLQVTHDGELLIPTPAWVSYQPQAVIVGRPARFIATRAVDGWALDPDALRRATEGPYTPRLLILNYPSNPTGGTFGERALEEIAAVARERGLIVLSDEIYGETHHEGRHVSISRFYPEGTIISSGLSKWCGAGGWRLGTFAFPSGLRWLLSAMTAVASETFTSTSAPIQYAAVRAFQGGLRIERYLWSSRRILRALGRWSAARLEADGVRVVPPVGAFYLFPDFSAHADALARRGIQTSDALAARLLAETGVALLPGSAFGRDPRELCARIAYVDFDGARALAAVEALGRDVPLDEAFLRAHAGPVMTAMETLGDWLRRDPSTTARV